jgi:hypothetical protein
MYSALLANVMRKTRSPEKLLGEIRHANKTVWPRLMIVSGWGQRSAIMYTNTQYQGQSPKVRPGVLSHAIVAALLGDLSLVSGDYSISGLTRSVKSIPPRHSLTPCLGEHKEPLSPGAMNLEVHRCYSAEHRSPRAGALSVRTPARPTSLTSPPGCQSRSNRRASRASLLEPSGE